MTQAKNIDKKINIKKPQVEFRNGWTVPIVCIVFAVAFTAVMLYLIALQVNKNKFYLKTEAEVVSVAEYTDYYGDEHYEVYVRYIVDEVKYKQKLTYWDEELEMGDIITIRYDVRNPNVIKTNNTFVTLIVIVSTVTVALYGVSTWLVIRKIRIDKTSLNDDGADNIIET